MRASLWQGGSRLLLYAHRPAFQQTFRKSSSIGKRSFESAAGPISRVPDFAFAFDIDGVLVRSAKPLPGASKSLSFLLREQIPFILLTNGGGIHETERIAGLNKKLGLDLNPNVIIQSHTPFGEMVEGRTGQEPLRDKCVLVVGGPGDRCRHVAKKYGFKSVVTPGDILMSCPSIWPFAAGFSDYYKAITQPLSRSIDPQTPSNGLKIDAILVFNDPRDWALDIQVIIDVLLSQQGIVGTYSDKNNSVDLPNRGFQQDGQPKLYFSNPDLLWAAEYHQPRLGQGGFFAALEGVWGAMTGGSKAGVQLQSTTIGKPHFETYEFAEKRLIQQRDNSFGPKSASTPLRNVYMIGDNPESDIRGAYTYNNHTGIGWTPVLVRTGVYPGGEPAWPPQTIVDGVEQAVEWSLKRSQWNALADDIHRST